MLTLQTTTNTLIVPDNIRIAITAINPMLVRDKGSNSLNFGLHGRNSKFLQATHSTGVKRNNQLAVDVSFISYKKACNMTFESLSKEQYTCKIDVDESAFYQKYRDKNIRDLTLGGARDYTDYPSNYTLLAKSSDDADFTMFRLYNPPFLDDTMHEGTITSQNDYAQVTFFHKSVPRTPFIYLCYLYEQLFQEHGYTVKYNYLRTNAHFKKLALYTNQSANDAGTDFYLAKHLPDYTISDIINAVSDLFNVHPIINETTKEVYLVSLEEKLKSAKIIDITKYAENDLSKTSEELTTKIVFKMSVETSDENQNPHKYLSSELDLTVEAAVATIANLPNDDAGVVRLVTDENYYYRREVDNEGVFSWNKYSINIQEHTLGDGDKIMEISSEFSAVQRKKTESTTPYSIRMKGNTPYRNNKQKIPLMLGFVGTADGRYALLNNSIESDEIFLNPESLFNYCFKNTANMWVNSYQPYECTLRLPATLLNNFDFSAIYQIRNTLFLIEELNYNLEADKITYEKSKLRAI